MARIGKRVRQLLDKSRDAAILAVDVYNKPSTRFRSEGFIVMMNVAWTSLFHAYFQRSGVKYFYREKGSRRYVRVDGQRKAWELAECVREYFGDENPPVRENLRFFLRIRNQIVHRFLPALDLDIFGECQAHLLNYERILLKEFGSRFSLQESLAIPLQLLSTTPAWRQRVMKELQSREYRTVKNFIDTYRANLRDDVWRGDEYSFRVFLIPKIGNHETSSDVAVEFVPYDSTDPEQLKQYEQLAAFVRERQVPVVNPGKLKPSDVCHRVKERIGVDMHASSHHVRCWRYFDVRPPSGSKQPARTKAKYCQYDAPHGDYVYTDEWVALLVKELAKPERRAEILG